MIQADSEINSHGVMATTSNRLSCLFKGLPINNPDTRSG